MVVTAPSPVRVRPVCDDNLCHYFCPCDENVSLCGLDITGEADCDIGCDCAPDCLVCVDMDRRGAPCPNNCGG